jgi:hypothetical protein
MKNIFKKASAILLAVTSLSFFPGDDCVIYAPAKQGMELEMKNFSDNNKPTGSSRIKVLSVTNGGRSIELQSEAFDKKDKSVGTGTYVMACENGVFTVDMRTMISNEQKESFKGMQVTVEGDKLDIPADPKAGQELKNGSVKMTAVSESPISFKLTMTVTNRKVAAIEDVAVPAGTFKCVKITYDAESKNIFTVRMKMAEWYAKEIGLVKSETYNTKDKLQSYTVLNSVK